MDVLLQVVQTFTTPKPVCVHNSRNNCTVLTKILQFLYASQIFGWGVGSSDTEFTMVSIGTSLDTLARSGGITNGDGNSKC